MKPPIRKAVSVPSALPQPPAQPIIVVKETPQWVVVNKKAGLLVEKSLHGFASIENDVTEHLKKMIRVPFVGIVHRLDRPVSGVLVVAKKKSTLKLLNEQFREGKTHKIYWAIVEKSPESKEGELRHFLRKLQAEKRSEILAKPAKDAVECRLTYRIIGTNAYGTLVAIQLLTGKFHQIRAQFAAIGCPILGDAKYGSTKKYLPDAIALHSYQLSFQDPISGENVVAHVSPPDLPHWKMRIEGAVQ
jgi:23S rRNA pseudouridine1911/1915/1917 synthase